MGQLLGRLAFVTAMLGGVLLLGLVVGNRIGQWRVAGRLAEKHDRLQGLLTSTLKGIEVGNPFPDMALWSTDGTRATRLYDLLPQGGLLFYVVAECESCADAVFALDQAVARSTRATLPVIVVTNARPDVLATSLRGRGGTLPIYWDAEGLLLEEHNLRTTRTYFIIDSDGVLRALGTTRFDPDEYAALISVE